MAGEHAVAAQLLVRGLNVFFPAIDTGVDLLCDNGCRVQVKSSHLGVGPSHKATYPEGIYQFEFKAWRSIAMNSTRSRRAPRPSLESYCDIVVLWGIEQNRFWVVPAGVFRGTQRVFLGPTNDRRFIKDIPEMQAMVEMGMSQVEIGKHFGIRQAAVCTRLQKATTRQHCESIRHDVRLCENAWENILNFGLVPESVATDELVVKETME